MSFTSSRPRYDSLTFAGRELTLQAVWMGNAASGVYHSRIEHAASM